MKLSKSTFENSRVSMAIAAALSASTLFAGAPALAQQTETAQNSSDDSAIEEVVVSASRLQGTATAVLQERKNQAFVADILGAEQISRTGDSDAASALRRVTGLTLVDDKFIYVRGLGERYSSTQLNGAYVPSPDPSRNVIPLDMFPAEIIESMAVQKSYSATMPANFGGGNVDIRLKSIPKDFMMTMGGKVGWNTENSGDGIWYEDGSDDWYGRDDGTRAAPNSIRDLNNAGISIDDTTIEENRALAIDLNRDYDPKSKSIDPDFGLNFAIGDRYDYNSDWSYGFLASAAYKNEWRVKEQVEIEDFTRGSGSGGLAAIRGYDEIDTTEHTVQWSGMFNFGVEYTDNHKIEVNSTILNDTVDSISDKLGFNENTNPSDGQRLRNTEVEYEERDLIANQVFGSHNFPELWYLGVDWFYSDSKSRRQAPGNISTRYIISDVNDDGIYDKENESSLSNSRTASRYSFERLDDEVENWGYDFSLPLTVGGTDFEFKAGANFMEKTRENELRRLDINTRALEDFDLKGHQLNVILSDDAIANATLTSNLLDDKTQGGDDYVAAQKIDAYYGEIDVFINNKWRLNAGVRWEDFQQLSVPLEPYTGEIKLPSNPTDEDYLALAFQEDDFYPALALTYFQNEDMQWRFSYGESVVRPDLREVSSAQYTDPITGFPIGGTPGVETTAIKNYDVRWEWYMESGNNLSVGLFYKDMDKPIETVQAPGTDGPPLIRIANADDGEVYGIEVEWLHDLGFFGKTGKDFFLSGNVTLSDSEITLDRQSILDQTGVSAGITNLERRMTGHSEWVVNMNLGYDSPNGEHSASLVYNVFGDRIIIPGIEGFDDAKEEPLHSLDLIYNYYPTYASTVTLKLKNMLDEEQEILVEDTVLRSSTKGTEISLSFKYEFE